MMLDRPSSKAVKVLSDITSQCHICCSAISAVPYLYNGTPLAFDVLAHQATISIKVQSLGEKAGLIILLCGISHECV